MNSLARGWKQFNCSLCGVEGVSAKIKSVCGLLEICETCARKRNLDTNVICFSCWHNNECHNVIRTCLQHQWKLAHDQQTIKEG